MFDNIAYAMGQGGSAGGEAAPFYVQFAPFILIFVIFYFLLIRPQQKKAKEHKDMITNIKKGDRIITSGGIYARVTGMDDTTLTAEISEKVRVKLVRSSVSTVIPTSNQPQATKDTKAVEKK